MEILKEIVTDFCLFSLIEGYLFCLFFEKIGGCRKFKWCEIFVFSFINCIVSVLLPPLFYQLIGLLYMATWIKLRDKKKNNLLISIMSSLYFLILEAFYYIIIDFLIGYNIEDKIFIFFTVIPIKIIEYIIIKKGDSIMKWWFGEVRKK